MISLIFWILAAAMNGFMDCLENENFFESILKQKKQSFWYKRESWKHAKKLFGYRFDAWHLFKSAMIISLAAAVILYKPVFGWPDIFLFGATWNVAFILVYHKYLKVK